MQTDWSDLLKSELRERVEKLAPKVQSWLSKIATTVRAESPIAQATVPSAGGLRELLAECPPKTPQWAREEAKRLVLLAETHAALAWPSFTEPVPLPRLEKGEERRRGWSIEVHRVSYEVFQTDVRAPGISREGAYRLVGSETSSTMSSWLTGQVAQYATKVEAMQAGHWRLCQQMAQQLVHSLATIHLNSRS